MMYINKRRFFNCIKNCVFFFIILLLCIFVWQHSGLRNREIVQEVRTYEIEYRTSANNNRIKEAVPVEVVYRYVTR